MVAMRLAGLASVLFGCLAFQTIPPAATLPVDRNDYKIPKVAPEIEIPKAMAAAKKDGKPVLLDLGAAWCLDCRVLWRYFETPEIGKILRDNFHLVEIDVGEVLKVDGPWQKWADPHTTGIPSIVLLDGNGAIIPNNTGVRWRTASTFSADTVSKYLLELAEIGRKHMQSAAEK